MAVKTIITEPNKLLRQISQPVESVGKQEQQLMNDMLDTMYDANGIGLAAIQIGIPKRIIVMDIGKEEKKEWALDSKLIESLSGGGYQRNHIRGTVFFKNFSIQYHYIN